MRTRTRVPVAATLVFGLGAATLGAHDLWVEPTTFSPASGQIVGARLRVGQDFLGDPLPRDPTLIREFIVEDSQGRRPLVGRDGADPAGLLRVGDEGLIIIGYHSYPRTVEQSGEKFTAYLAEEGLDDVAALRTRRGDTGGVRELFSRSAKSLLLSGKAEDGRGDSTLGFAIELVAERNPYTMQAGQDLPVRLTYEGRPLVGALVVAMNAAGASAKLSQRSDRNGRTVFRLPRPGKWMVKAVHMIPARSGTNADWESFWASLTFILPDAPAVSRTSSR